MTHEEPAFKIKNAKFSLFVLHINTTDFDKFKIELAARITQTPDFFLNTPMVIGLEPIENSGITPNFTELMLFINGLGIQTAGVVGGSNEQREAAVQAGLGLFPDTPTRPNPQPINLSDQPIDSVLQLDNSGTEPALRSTIIIEKPVRAGQRIYAKGSDLVVLAIVNAGAELIADGDIHIYAPMRGRAIAGAHGNQEARIFVQRLEAELISIAGCFQVFENGVPENVRGKPAQIHLEGTHLVFQPLPS